MEKTGRGVSQVILVFVLLVCLILLGLSRTCFAAVGKAAYTSFKQFRPELRYAAENDAVTRTEDALLLKTGYGYGYAKGERFRLEEASYPDVLDGNVLVPRGVIEKKLGVHLSLEEDKLISLDTLQDVGLSSFYDSKTGLIIIGSEANMPNAETDRPFIYEACNLVTQASALDATKTGERPVLFETDEMLQFAKSMAEKKYDPWYSSWLKIKNHADEALKRGPLPYLGPSATQFRFAAYADFTKARYLTCLLYTSDAADD